MIPARTIGTRLPGFSHGYAVPIAPISEGRVIFFLVSRSDCDKLLSCAKREFGDRRGLVIIHGGTTFNPDSLPSNCWCFCTDVVGQAVTVPGCTAVVDFLEEMKPETRLEFNGLSLLYRYDLVRRIIGLATAKQRKGRTGRTNAGHYVCPIGLGPVDDYVLDKRTAAVVLLSLEADKKLNWDLIEQHHNANLQSALVKLR